MDIIDWSTLNIPIIGLVGSKNIYQAVFSTKFIDDERLRIDITHIQESIEKEQVGLKQIKADRMLADCDTKT